MNGPAACPVEELQPTAEHTKRDLAWSVSFLALTILAALLLWYPVLRMSARIDINYVEGWNSYPARAAAEGIPLYGSPHAYTVVNYPPVSFHVIGLLGRLSGDYTMAGRQLALASFFAIALLLALLVTQMTRGWRYGVFAALCFLIWMAAFKPDRIGMDDPQLFATAINVLALYVYVRKAESVPWMCGSAALFAVSVFTKHNLVAFPIAVAIHMALRHKRHFRWWLAAGALTGAALLALTLAIDGRYFFDHLLLARTYSYGNFRDMTGRALVFFQAPAAVAVLWCFQNAGRGQKGVLLWCLAVAAALAIPATAGRGIDLNIHFDTIIATAAIAAVAVCEIEPLLARLPAPNAALLAVLLVPFFGASAATLMDRILTDSAGALRLPALERETASAVSFLKSAPGPALCENLLLCFWAGQPETYDAFAVRESIRAGRIPEAKVLEMLRCRRFAAIELEMQKTEPPDGSARLRFSSGFMKELMRSYRPGLQTAGYTIFVPNVDAPPPCIIGK